MNLEAQLSTAAIERLLRKLAPIRIHMTRTDEDTHWLELDAPRAVDLVPDRGVRVECTGRVRYSVESVPFRLEIRSLVVLIRPVVVDSRLYFHVEVERSESQHAQDVVDDATMQLINRALAPRRTRMVWDFGRTLTATLPLPVRVEPLDVFRIDVQHGVVTIDRHAVRFRVALETEPVRYQDHPSHVEPTSGTREVEGALGAIPPR